MNGVDILNHHKAAKNRLPVVSTEKPALSDHGFASRQPLLHILITNQRDGLDASNQVAAQPSPEPEPSWLQQNSTIMPLTIRGAEVILATLKEDKRTMQITLPFDNNNKPFITIDHDTCVQLMQLHTGVMSENPQN